MWYISIIAIIYIDWRYMPKIVTTSEYIKRVKNINADISVIGEYINARTKILHKCNVCGYEWLSLPHNVLRGMKCPRCSKREHISKEQYIEKLAAINPNIELIGEYVNLTTKTEHRCKICGNKLIYKPWYLLEGRGCAICSGRKVGEAPEYKNSIWSSEYKVYFDGYITEEQMKNTMPHSGIKIEMTCPYCGRKKMVKPNDFLHYGFGCICNDGISYPNKFIYNFLEQLGISYFPEQRFDWSDSKIYDFYIPSARCIIEAHGCQHYIEGFYCKGRRTIEEEQENDRYKKDIAIKNGIKNYIILDCRESNKEWIKNSIMSSKLPLLLNFNDENINWNQCEEFALSNISKYISALWNNGMPLWQIEERTKLCRHTITKYLKIATELDWCNYSKEESLRRGKLYQKNKLHEADKAVH